MADDTATTGDDFEAGKVIAEKLKDLPKNRQERVLRWVAEGLGITNPTVARPAPAPLPTPTPPATTPPTPPTSRMDIKTFVAAKKPRTDVQFVTVAAYYYRFEAPADERRETVNAQGVQDATRLAGRARLSNPRHTLKNAKTQGYLDSRAVGEYAVNTVGENLVALTLPGSGGEAAGQTSRRPRKAARTKKPNKRKRG